MSPAIAYVGMAEAAGIYPRRSVTYTKYIRNCSYLWGYFHLAPELLQSLFSPPAAVERGKRGGGTPHPGRDAALPAPSLVSSLFNRIGYAFRFWEGQEE